jgi:ABC transport system ATP-binding/permease protein
MLRNEETPRLYDANARTFLLAHETEGETAATDRVAFRTPAFLVRVRDQQASLTAVTEGVAVDHQIVHGVVPLSHRSLIVAPNRCAYVFLLREDPGLSTPDDAQQWILGMLPRRVDEPRTRSTDPSDTPFPILSASLPLRRGRNVIGRDAERASIVLPGLQVSRTHAAIEWDGSNRARIVDLNSFNGTFVNGDRVAQLTHLALGDRIDIGSVTLAYAGDRLTVQSSAESIELVVRGVSYEAPEAGRSKTLLDDVTLAIRPREFVVIIGPSGSGKTLLIKAMAGRLKPTAGTVYINRGNLVNRFESLKRFIGYVPQRDVLHDVLRLGRALDYSARLRLPPDVSRGERLNLLASVVNSMELAPHVGTRIARLSGGQTRRASLANEMLSRPGLLLVDEVTSGLDEKTDGELMRLFRRLADNDGKTVVCVTHNLNYVTEMAHKIVVLAPGGKLAYFGTPRTALEYFGVKRLGEIYPLVESGQAADWKLKYEKSADYERFVHGRFPVLLPTSLSARPRRRRSLQQSLRIFFQEWLLLSARATAVKVAQPRWLALLAVQCVGLAILIGWLFGDLSKVELSADEVAALNNAPTAMASGAGLKSVPAALRSVVETEAERLKQTAKDRWRDQKQGTLTLRLLVSLVMCALWLGCNNASAEIVRERSIFESEREIGLEVSAYVCSKLALLGAVSFLQIFVLLAFVRWMTQLEGQFGPQLAMLTAVGLVSVLLGLAISAWSPTSEISTVLVPIAVIPQILLAGTMVPLEGLTKTVAELLIPLHWAYRGLVSQIAFKPELSQLLQLVGALRNNPPTDSRRAWLMLSVHAVVLAALCYIGLRVSDPRDLVRRLIAQWRWRKSRRS